MRVYCRFHGYILWDTWWPIRRLRNNKGRSEAEWSHWSSRRMKTSRIYRSCGMRRPDFSASFVPERSPPWSSCNRRSVPAKYKLTGKYRRRIWLPDMGNARYYPVRRMHRLRIEQIRSCRKRNFFSSCVISYNPPYLRETKIYFCLQKLLHSRKICLIITM